MILLEQGRREHVAKQQHNPEHFVRLDASRNDALGEVARVLLQRLHGAGFEHGHVVVIHGRGLDKDLFLGHRREQTRLGDTPRPLLAKLRTILAQVRHQLGQQCLGCGLARVVCRLRVGDRMGRS